jgi:hypothetical protein
MSAAHHCDVYEVDGMPGRFYARCLCGWEGPPRDPGPGNHRRADDDGEEHMSKVCPTCGRVPALGRHAHGVDLAHLLADGPPED